MEKNRAWKMAAVVLLFFVAISIIGSLTAREKNSLNFAERGVRILAYPFQLLFNSATERIQVLSIDINELAELRDANTQLRKEISNFQYELDLLKKDQEENLRLKSLLEYKETTADYFTLQVAKVIGKSSSNWHRSIFINLGRQDGLTENMVVINHQGLVGKVVNLSGRTAEVLLILDSDSGVGGRLSGTRKTIGVVQGMGLDRSGLAFVHLPKEMEIQVGDRVVTSGLDDFYPPELNLGEVLEIVETERGFTKTAVLASSVDFESLEEVFVITNFRKEKFVWEPSAEGQEQVQ